MNSYSNTSTQTLAFDFVTQSTPKHVAIIMDGNRRWARARGLPAAAGHRAGLKSAQRLLPAIRSLEIETLTLFGFASANWRRSEREVSHLLQLAEEAIERFLPRCLTEDIRIEVIGRRDRLPASLLRHIEQAQRATLRGNRTLRVALDYSSREAILAAAQVIDADADTAAFTRWLCPGGDVDLLIRTGKEQRLSDFLLWESAFAELYFPDVYWPEFNVETLEEALCWYRHRNRRFGR